MDECFDKAAKYELPDELIGQQEYQPDPEAVHIVAGGLTKSG